MSKIAIPVVIDARYRIVIPKEIREEVKEFRDEVFAENPDPNKIASEGFDSIQSIYQIMQKYCSDELLQAKNKEHISKLRTYDSQGKYKIKKVVTV